MKKGTVEVSITHPEGLETISFAPGGLADQIRKHSSFDLPKIGLSPYELGFRDEDVWKRINAFEFSKEQAVNSAFIATELRKELEQLPEEEYL